MANPLRKSIDIAIKKNARLEREFYRLGVNNPKGVIPAAYFTANKAIKAVLPDKGRPTATQLQEVTVILSVLMSATRSAIIGALDNGERIGVAALDDQMKAYGDPIPDREPQPAEIETMRQMAVQATVTEVEQQALTTQALLLSGSTAPDVTGGDSRSGILQAVKTLRTVSNWAAHISDATFMLRAQSRSSRGVFNYQKQVIAALGTHTTETCRRAHAQIQDLDDMFKITGTPRFSDERMHPPFHHYCRTSMTLYRDEFDDGLTEKMRSAAAKLGDKRA